MRIVLANTFIKSLRKQSPGTVKQFKSRRDLFLENPYHPILHNHKLTGEYTGFRSFNVNGDVRVVYEVADESTVYFVDIGTHSELYE